MTVAASLALAVELDTRSWAGRLPIERPRWHALAACRGRPEAFWPEVGGPCGQVLWRKFDPTPALELCSECQVVVECARAELEDLDRVGRNGIAYHVSAGVIVHRDRSEEARAELALVAADPAA